MAESMKPRFAVDLDEIERQLALSHSSPAPSQSAQRNDPLAELARIVGQDDPFQSILAADRVQPPSRRGPSAFDDLFVREERQHRHDEAGGRSDLDPPGPMDLDSAYGTPSPSYESYDDYQAPAAAYAQQDAQGFADPAEFDDPVPVREYPARNSRKGLVAVAAVLGAAVLGVGGALVVGGSPAGVTGGEPPVVVASTEPTKVPPQSPGGMEFPHQNKQIYERAAQDAPTKVVNREEQPVDIRQATRAAGPEVTASAAPRAPAAAPGGLSLGEPRKVRTISIRPDGTLILPDAKPAPAPTRVAAAAPMPSVTPPAPLPPAAPVAAETPPSAATSTTPTTPAPPRAAASTPPTSGGSSPQAAAAPAQPTPQRVASVQPTAPAPAPAPVEAAPVGGFAVQLGVSGSEAEAKAALQRLQQKFSDLSGKPPLIRKAEVNGNSLYRVRVGPMSREEASSLCSKIQGQGGQCFVAKN